MVIYRSHLALLPTLSLLAGNLEGGLLENNSWTHNDAVQSRSTNLIRDHHNDKSFSGIELGRV